MPPNKDLPYGEWTIPGVVFPGGPDNPDLIAYLRDNPDTISIPAMVKYEWRAAPAPERRGLLPGERSSERHWSDVPMPDPGAMPPVEDILAFMRQASADARQNAVWRPAASEDELFVPLQSRRGNGDLSRLPGDDLVDRSHNVAIKAVPVDAGAGVTRVSATGTDTALAGGALLLGGLLYLFTRPPASKAPIGRPMMAEQSPPSPEDQAKPILATSDLAKPGEAILADDRRKYILDGDGEGGGGHGSGRGTAGKSEFPLGWTDDATVEAIKEVANDAAAARRAGPRGRTVVEGARGGVEIRVIIGADRISIISAYPTNTTRNPIY